MRRKATLALAVLLGVGALSGCSQDAPSPSVTSQPKLPSYGAPVPSLTPEDDPTRTQTPPPSPTLNNPTQRDEAPTPRLGGEAEDPRTTQAPVAPPEVSKPRVAAPSASPRNSAPPQDVKPAPAPPSSAPMTPPVTVPPAPAEPTQPAPTPPPPPPAQPAPTFLEPTSRVATLVSCRKDATGNAFVEIDLTVSGGRWSVTTQYNPGDVHENGEPYSRRMTMLTSKGVVDLNPTWTYQPGDIGTITLYDTTSGVGHRYLPANSVTVDFATCA